MSSVRPVRLAAAVAGAMTVVVGGATLAAAHVSVDPGDAAAGGYAVLTFAVPHGCEGSSTTEVAIDIPEEILALTPTVNPNWEVEKRAADGSPAAEGDPVTTVAYTASAPLPHDLRDTFELSVRLPDEAGQTLAFPVVQTCEEGEVAWEEIADDGEDPHELAYPAPLVEVSEPVDDGTASGDSGVSAMSVAGFGTGVAGVLLGGSALLYARRRTRAHGG